VKTDPPSLFPLNDRISSGVDHLTGTHAREARAETLAFVLVTVPLIFYLAPGLTALDAGELLAASTELGIAHPPGLALFCLVHKAVTFGLPFGDIAFRGNCASALLAGLAGVWSVRLAVQFGVRPYVAAVGAPWLLTSPLFILHSVTVEVYTGVLWLVLVSASYVARGYRTQDRRDWVTCAFVLGLCIGGHHGEIRLFAAVLMGVVLLKGLNVRLWAFSAVFGMFGFAITLYLPLRARLEPWRNWGDPSTFDGWLSHFWADRIRSAYGEQMGQVSEAVIHQFVEHVVLMQWPLALLGLFGLIIVARRPAGWLLIAIACIDGTYSVLLNPMGVRDMQNGLVLTGILAVGLLVSLNHLWTLLSRLERRPSRWTPWMCAAGALVILIVSIPAPTLSTDRSLPHVLNIAEDHLAPETLLLTASDDFSAGLAFRQVVEGARPDIAVVVRQHVRYASSVDPVYRRLPAALEGWMPGASLGALIHASPENSSQDSWPLAWEWAGGLDGALRPPVLTPSFPVYVRSDTVKPQSDRAYFNHLTRWLDVEHPAKIRLASQLAGDLSQFLLVNGAPSRAMEIALWATEITPESSSRWIELGVACSSLSGTIRQTCAPTPTSTQGTRPACHAQWQRLMERAVVATEHALQLDPHQGTARTNLIRYLINLERYSEARTQLNRYATDVSTSDGFAFRALMAANEGDLDHARVLCTQALEYDAHHTDARDLLFQLARQARLSGRFDEALRILDTLALSGATATICIERGIVHLQGQRWARAYDAFQDAIRLDPDARQAHFGLSSLRLESLLWMRLFPPTPDAP